MNTTENSEQGQPLAAPLERPVRPLVERLRDYAQCSDSDIDEAADEIERAWAARDAAVADLEAHAEAEVRRAVAAERERSRQVVAYMATSRKGTVRFTDNPDAARELEGYGWAITPLADAGPNVGGNRLAPTQEQR